VRKQLTSVWPLLCLLIAFVAGAVAAGPGAGVVTAILSVLVIGPVYLVQRGIQRRRAPALVEAPRSSEDRAKASSVLFRRYALVSAVVALVAVIAANARGGWLGGEHWTVYFVFLSVLGVSSSLFLWGLSDAVVGRRDGRWAFQAGVGVNLALAVAAAAVAVTNAQTHWLGGNVWTIGATAVALFSLRVAWEERRLARAMRRA